MYVSSFVHALQAPQHLATNFNRQRGWKQCGACTRLSVSAASCSEGGSQAHFLFFTLHDLVQRLLYRGLLLFVILRLLLLLLLLLLVVAVLLVVVLLLLVVLVVLVLVLILTLTLMLLLMALRPFPASTTDEVHKHKTLWHTRFLPIKLSP